MSSTTTRLVRRRSLLICGVILLAVLIVACSMEPQVVAPNDPSGVTATAGPGYIEVAWTDNSDNETGFEIYRSVGASSMLGSQQLNEPFDTVPPDTTSYIDLDVEMNTPYEYVVVAAGDAGSSAGTSAAAPAEVAPGVDLMVGTVDRVYSDDTTGTVFVFYMVFDEDVLMDPAETLDVSFTGPPGWNDGFAVTGSIAIGSTVRSDGFGRLQLHGIDSVAGTYTFTAEVSGVTYQATAELIDTAYRHGRPGDLSVTPSQDHSEVTGTWTTPPEALTTYASIHIGEWGGMLYRTVGEGSASFSGLALDDGLYLFDVMSMNVDMIGYPIKVPQLGQSAMYAPFGVGNPQSALCASPEQVIDIPDPALRAGVLNGLYRSSGVITCIDMQLLEWVWADGAGVESIEGLQYADNLRDVGLGNWNLVTDIEPLRGLQNLEAVTFWGSPITDASPLAGKSTLRHIDIGGTYVSDLSFLEGMDELRSLFLWSLDGIDLAPIHDLTQIQTLALEDTGLTDASAEFLEHFTQIFELWLGGNDLTDLTPLVANVGLDSGDTLRVSGNSLDLTDPTIMAQIQALLDRGVDVEYEPQN